MDQVVGRKGESRSACDEITIACDESVKGKFVDRDFGTAESQEL